MNEDLKSQQKAVIEKEISNTLKMNIGVITILIILLSTFFFPFPFFFLFSTVFSSPIFIVYFVLGLAIGVILIFKSIRSK